MRGATLIVLLVLGVVCCQEPEPSEPPPEPPAEPEAEPAPPEEPPPPAAAAAETVVEHAEALPPPPANQLATTRYRPSPAEAPHLEALDPAEQSTGSAFEDYSITGKVGTGVSWFGIIRGLQEDAAANQTRVLVEMKYFDGLTDTHILCLSWNGAGDFVARVPGVGLDLELLSLVRVYGTVAAEKDGVPRVDATFVRHWAQPLFTFLMAYGTEQGNPTWREHCTVPDGSIYDPRPDADYYLRRLGRPADFESVTVPE
jgi:hypothetical protein